MIWASNEEGFITYAGPEWEGYTGQAPSQALGDGWLEMLHPDDREPTRVFFKRACASARAFTICYRLSNPVGVHMPMTAGAMPSISPIDGAFLGYLGVLNEIADVEASALGNGIGRFILAPPSPALSPLTPIDIVADYLLLARSTAENAGEERLLASIDFAISEVMRRLGLSTTDLSKH